jgi:hypothetical protein
MVHSELNFSYTLVPSKNGKYGIKTKNNEWTGQIGLVQRNELDLSIMDLTVLFERSKVSINEQKLRCLKINNANLYILTF